MLKPCRKPVFALLALSLVPSLVLGRTGILPCPHMEGMVGAMEHGAMPMAQMDGTEPRHTGHAQPTQGTPHDGGTGAPLGHAPCTCEGGCPGAMATESLPESRLVFAPSEDVWTKVATTEPSRRRVATSVPYLLPFPLGPPLRV